MLLVIDVGNTNTVLGVFARVAEAREHAETPRYERLVANWRVATSRTSTVDEYGVLFRNLFSMAGLEVKGIHGIVISSVVPPLDPVLRQVCERYFNLHPLYIELGVKTGCRCIMTTRPKWARTESSTQWQHSKSMAGLVWLFDFGPATTFT